MSLVVLACTEPSSRDAERRELSERRAAWRAHGLRDYAFDFQITCCLNDGGHHIEVRNAQVTQVTALDPTRGGDPGTASWPTVDSLFARATRALSARDNVVEISYDPRYDYPTRISSFVRNVGDGGSVVTASHLEPLTP